MSKEIFLGHEAFVVDVFHGFVQDDLCRGIAEGKTVLCQRIEYELCHGQGDAVAVFIFGLAYNLFSIAHNQLGQEQLCAMRGLAQYVGNLSGQRLRGGLLGEALCGNVLVCLRGA